MTSYTCSLNQKQGNDLQGLLHRKGWNFISRPHTRFAAGTTDTSLSFFNSGKLLVQGKGTREFIEFILEPEILKEIRLGYEHLYTKFRGERIGVDESGKGDYFGPLVIAGVFVTQEGEKRLRDLNVRDSKKISDRRIRDLRKIIRSDYIFSVVAIGPERYNQLYATMGNMNNILAWGHARVIENLLSRAGCKKAVLDQFGKKELVLGALMKKSRNIEVFQEVRGESDMAVAAASVLARGEFVNRMEKLSEEFKIPLPKGNNKELVIKTARKVISKWGMEALVRVAKVHFKTTKEILASR